MLLMSLKDDIDEYVHGFHRVNNDVEMPVRLICIWMNRLTAPFHLN